MQRVTSVSKFVQSRHRADVLYRLIVYLSTNNKICVQQVLHKDHFPILGWLTFYIYMVAIFPCVFSSIKLLDQNLRNSLKRRSLDVKHLPCRYNTIGNVDDNVGEVFQTTVDRQNFHSVSCNNQRKKVRRKRTENAILCNLPVEINTYLL